jgi:hypothetical protein
MLPAAHKQSAFDSQPPAETGRILVKRCLVSHAPAQIDSLEAGSVLFAKRAELGKHVALQRVALLLQVLKRRTDEDAKRASGSGHGADPERDVAVLL